MKKISISLILLGILFTSCHHHHGRGSGNRRPNGGRGYSSGRVSGARR